jgi:hypothetical protein
LAKPIPTGFVVSKKAAENKKIAFFIQNSNSKFYEQKSITGRFHQLAGQFLFKIRIPQFDE